MSFEYDFTGYIAKDTNLTVGSWKTIPNSRFKPTRTGILTPNIYINCQYNISDSASRDGRLWVRIMRENPSDDTMNYQIPLSRGYDYVLDSRCFEKRWTADDLDRAVHVEVRVTNVKSAYLNDTCYAAYSIKW
jgi:hypothetical protein